LWTAAHTAVKTPEGAGALREPCVSHVPVRTRRRPSFCRQSTPSPATTNTAPSWCPNGYPRAPLGTTAARMCPVGRLGPHWCAITPKGQCPHRIRIARQGTAGRLRSLGGAFGTQRDCAKKRGGHGYEEWGQIITQTSGRRRRLYFDFLKLLLEKGTPGDGPE
jgi:hypothetical protein